MKIASLATIGSEGVSHNQEIAKKRMLEKGDAPRLTSFSQAVFGPGQVAPAHSHDDMFEVFFVRQGRGSITVDGREYSLETDDCVVVAPGERHEVSNPYREDLVLLYFGLEA